MAMVPPRAAGRVAGSGPAGGPDRGRDAVVASRIPLEGRDPSARTSRGRRREQGVAYRSLQLANDGEQEGPPPRARAIRFRDEGAAEFETITNDAALLREPHLDVLRAKLLRTALGFYQELQASLAEDASSEARFKLSDAYSRIASISWELGLQDEALATHRQALALVEQMAAAAPDDPEVRAALAACHTRIGFTLRTRGRPAEALRPYEQAREIQEQLARENPAEPAIRKPSRGPSPTSASSSRRSVGTAEATRLHQQAIAIHQDLVTAIPPTLRIAAIWPGAGAIFSLTLQPPETRLLPCGWLSGPRWSMKNWSRPIRDYVEFRWRLARCLDEVGRIRSRSGRRPKRPVPLERVG